MNKDFILSILSDSLHRLDEKVMSRWHSFDIDETLRVPEDKARAVLDELIERLRDNYPFWHPSYAGQMLKPPHAIASIAYFLAQQINPNNHALDGGPATAKMETEVIAELAAMFGYQEYLGHLTSSGTIANLEALWVARSLHPDKAVAFSEQAHYTHGRMCEVIGAKTVEIAVDGRGRLDLDDLRAKLKSGTIGTVVMTCGTTSLGAVDAIHEALTLRNEFDFRIHIDGAYGGFFRLLATDSTTEDTEDHRENPTVEPTLCTSVPSVVNLLDKPDAAAFRAIAECDSIVVDPHKHGLQPYGCGSVLFRDPSVGRFYKHDSPYTYFTSDELHLGEISLECSRAGAAAAALWTTLKCFPLNRDEGLGAVLGKTRLAALEWARLMNEDERLQLITEPSLDIITYFPRLADKRVSAISNAVNITFDELMNDKHHPVYLAKMQMKPQLLKQFPDLEWDAPVMTVFRSVLMRPEQLSYVPTLHERVSTGIRTE